MKKANSYKDLMKSLNDLAISQKHLKERSVLWTTRTI